MASPDAAPDAVTQCPKCGTTSPGKFCSNCGTPFAGATCGACGAPLAAGAKFCHRCGAPAGSSQALEPRSFASALPWSVAGIALVALIALVAGQRFARSAGEPTSAAAPAEAAAPPDISSLTPAEAAARLYNRVMGAHERGRADTVQIFAPMAITAYQMLGALDLDQRYDLGRIAAVAGDEPLARAQADTILARNPKHLLGLILAANAAHIRKDSAAEQGYHARLVAAAPAERATRLPEYVAHDNDITIALDARRP